MAPLRATDDLALIASLVRLGAKNQPKMPCFTQVVGSPLSPSPSLGALSDPIL